MSANKVVKPISLNKTKTEDCRILAHIEGVNFSGYVKRLILADIDRKERMKAAPATPIKAQGGAIKFTLGE